MYDTVVYVVVDPLFQSTATAETLNYQIALTSSFLFCYMCAMFRSFCVSSKFYVHRSASV